MDTVEKSKALEVLLFIYGEAMPISKIKKLLMLTGNELDTALKHLDKRLEASGLMLVTDQETVSLGTRPEFAALANEIVKLELHAELTPAALETLAIVLYAGPLTRARIDYIRGVNSSFILRSLLLRGLVVRHHDLSKTNAYIYSASTEMIRHLGLPNASKLPDYAKYRGILGQLKFTDDTLAPAVGSGENNAGDAAG